MVKNRGIEVALISQFDIQRLPEFSMLPDPRTVEKNVVIRYVPIYPGSQIWFEYTVEPPHPPGAAYFFKLLVNGHPVTAWDCTEKHGFNGKMMYILEKGITDANYYSASPLRRKGFKFRNKKDDVSMYEETTNDYLEMRIYRIEHRKRVREPMPEPDPRLDSYCGTKLEWINSGELESGRPRRRYKYQLLDPAETPFATFRFLHRTHEFLLQKHLLEPPAARAWSSPPSSLFWFDTSSTSLANIMGIEVGSIEQGMDVHDQQQTIASSPLEGFREAPIEVQGPSPARSQELVHDTYLSPGGPEESLSAMVRDGVESLQLDNVRPAGGHDAEHFGLRGGAKGFGSTSKKNLSPRQKLKRKLMLKHDGIELGTEKAKRPLSPFNNGGLLRRLFSPELSPSAPTQPTQGEPGHGGKIPTVRGIDTPCINLASSSGATRTDKGGKTLMRILSRRVTRKTNGSTENDGNMKLSSAEDRDD